MSFMHTFLDASRLLDLDQDPHEFAHWRDLEVRSAVLRQERMLEQLLEQTLTSGAMRDEFTIMLVCHRSPYWHTTARLA